MQGTKPGEFISIDLESLTNIAYFFINLVDGWNEYRTLELSVQLP